jgi:RNA-directed DNA polymerase
MIRHGRHFVSFLPAVSRDAIKTMGRQIRCWHLARRSGTSLGQLARMINSIAQGWMNYYGRFFTPRELEIIRMAANGLSNRRSRPISWRRYARSIMGWVRCTRSCESAGGTN